MDTAPITYDSFRTIFVDTGPSIWSTVWLIRDFTLRRNLQSRIAMLFIVTTMVFILAFPTLGSAMAGYKSIVSAYIPENDSGNRILFFQFLPVLYIIHDGERIGKTSDFPVTANSSDPYYVSMVR